MKQLLALLLGALVISGAHAQQLSSAADKTYNLVTDFGATCNGSGDDGLALTAAATAMRAYQAANAGAAVTLIIPPGSNCVMNSCNRGTDGQFPFAFVTSLTFIANRANITLTANGNCIVYGPASVDFRSNGPMQGNCCVNSGSTHSTVWPFNPNLVGDVCVTMTTPGSEVAYPIGRWVVVAGDGVQTNSYPPNYANWEYAQVVWNSGGKVCFKQPLQHVYPNTGMIDLTVANCVTYCGGPGALVLMDAAWDTTWHFIGGTWISPSAEVEWGGRTVINDNLTWIAPSEFCYLPSFSQTVTLNNNQYGGCSIEADKEVDQFIINGGQIGFNVSGPGGNIIFQSPSFNSLTVNNGAIVSTAGTPLKTFCNNSTMNISMGTTYGSPGETFAGNNCILKVAPGSSTGVPIHDGSAFNGFAYGTGYQNFLYIGSGQFQTDPSSLLDICGGDLPEWIMIGGHMKLRPHNDVDGDNYFTITSYNITGTGSYPFCTNGGQITVTTSLTGGSAPPGTIGGLANQALNITCVNCTGSSQALELSMPLAQNAALNTYVNRTYTCLNNIPNIPGSLDINAAQETVDNFTVAGSWDFLKINVTVADTNPADCCGGSAARIGVGGGGVYNTVTGVETSFNTVISLLTTGLRTINQTTATGPGDQGSPPGANSWFAANGAGVSEPRGGDCTTFGGFPCVTTNGPAAQCPVMNVEIHGIR